MDVFGEISIGALGPEEISYRKNLRYVSILKKRDGEKLVAANFLKDWFVDFGVYPC